MRAGVGEGHRCGQGRSGGGGCVLEGVGEGLLDHPVDGQLAARGERSGRSGLAAELQVHGEARATDLFDEGGQVVHGRLGGAVGVGVVVAQDAQEAAEFGQGLSAGGADRLQRLGRALRAPGCRIGPAVRQACDDGQVVADDVVHLPRDAGPFGCGRQAGLLVAFVLQSVGPFDQGLGVVAARTYRDTQERHEDEPSEVRDELPVPDVRDARRAGHHRGAEDEPGDPEPPEREAQRDL